MEKKLVTDICNEVIQISSEDFVDTVQQNARMNYNERKTIEGFPKSYIGDMQNGANRLN